MRQGERIRTIRIQRGLTQQQLGELCGFSETSAGVRIRQYESSIKAPKEDTLLLIAKALNINVMAIKDYDMSCVEDIIETLLWIDTETGIDIFPAEQYEEEVNAFEHNGYLNIINNSASPIYGLTINSATINKYLKEWYKLKLQLANGTISLDQYNNWKWNWPNNY